MSSLSTSSLTGPSWPVINAVVCSGVVVTRMAIGFIRRNAVSTAGALIVVGLSLLLMFRFCLKMFLAIIITRKLIN